jgi:hypothetical protein
MFQVHIMGTRSMMREEVSIYDSWWHDETGWTEPCRNQRGLEASPDSDYNGPCW